MAVLRISQHWSLFWMKQGEIWGEIHIFSLDYAMACDRMRHEATICLLQKTGLPPGFTRYIAKVYNDSSTVLEMQGSRSEPINVKRGVRQVDPLFSPFLLLCC